MKGSQILAKYPLERFCHAFSSLSGKLIWKMSPLVLGKALVVFVHRLTANGKYPVHVCENLDLPIQMQLSLKRKTFSQSLVTFLESTSNSKHFEKKHNCHS